MRIFYTPLVDSFSFTIKTRFFYVPLNHNLEVFFLYIITVEYIGIRISFHETQVKNNLKQVKLTLRVDFIYYTTATIKTFSGLDTLKAEVGSFLNSKQKHNMHVVITFLYF